MQKTYDGENLIVRDLNLDIRRGEFDTAGAVRFGKTTCLMMLAGTGRRLRARDPARRSGRRTAAHKRNIGMVFQNYALFPHMTVRENLRFRWRSASSRRPRSIRKSRAPSIWFSWGPLAIATPNKCPAASNNGVALARALVLAPNWC